MLQFFMPAMPDRLVEVTVPAHGNFPDVSFVVDRQSLAHHEAVQTDLAKSEGHSLDDPFADSGVTYRDWAKMSAGISRISKWHPFESRGPSHHRNKSQHRKK